MTPQGAAQATPESVVRFARSWVRSLRSCQRGEERVQKGAPTEHPEQAPILRAERALAGHGFTPVSCRTVVIPVDSALEAMRALRRSRSALAE